MFHQLQAADELAAAQLPSCDLVMATFLKRAEHEDWYDRSTGFNPFHTRV